MSEVILKKLCKKWGDVVAVSDVSMTIDDGEFVAILGPSGCGKSTTLFLLAGVYLPSSGDIYFDGIRVNDVEARLRNVGIVFQSYALYPNMSVLQNILFPTRFQKLHNAEEKARDMAELVQVGDLLDRKPAELSGGQQQRVALARALIKAPNLLLLDEPLSNLDATLRLTMRTEIKRITRELGVTTVLVTHDQMEATTMADKIICMNSGTIEQVGSSLDLYARPNTAFVAEFIGSPAINLVHPDNPSITLPDGVERIGIRPENLYPSETGLLAVVEDIEPMGRETLVSTKTSIGPLKFLESVSATTLRLGDQIRLSAQPETAILFDKSGHRVSGSFEIGKFDA